MKKEDVLAYLELDELPTGVPKSNKKCAALVNRANRTQDYVIAMNGGIVVDKKSKAAAVSIVEFYPVPEVTQVKIHDETDWRKETIAKLVKSGMKQNILQFKKDEELKKFLKAVEK